MASIQSYKTLMTIAMAGAIEQITCKLMLQLRLLSSFIGATGGAAA
jgi:hypothetical protein